MTNISFDQSAIDTLYEGFTNHTHPQMRLRMQMVYLKSQGLTHTLICEICRVSRPTLSRYLKEYKAKGIAVLLHNQHKGQPSKLHDFSDRLCCTNNIVKLILNLTI